MSDVVRQVNILSKVIESVAREFNVPVYSNEVLEEFRKPCFFVAASSKMSPCTDNVVEKELTIALTYFAKDSEKNEITYLDVIDRVQLIFQSGIKVNDRYLHIESVEDDRVGEERDILQITIVIPYLEQVVKQKETDEIMGEVSVEIRTQYDHSQQEIEQEIWGGSIDKDSV